MFRYLLFLLSHAVFCFAAVVFQILQTSSRWHTSTSIRTSTDTFIFMCLSCIAANVSYIYLHLFCVHLFIYLLFGLYTGKWLWLHKNWSCSFYRVTGSIGSQKKSIGSQGQYGQKLINRSHGQYVQQQIN